MITLYKLYLMSRKSCEFVDPQYVAQGPKGQQAHDDQGMRHNLYSVIIQHTIPHESWQSILLCWSMSLEQSTTSFA